jgi:hypothetical protein
MAAAGLDGVSDIREKRGGGGGRGEGRARTGEKAKSSTPRTDTPGSRAVWRKLSVGKEVYSTVTLQDGEGATSREAVEAQATGGTAAAITGMATV